MTTVAAIAAKAMTAVAAKITDAVQTAVAKRSVQGAYNVTTGAYATAEVEQTGRAVIDGLRPMASVFPAYVAGPGDELILMEGFVGVAENDTLTINGIARTIRAVQDITGAGTLFYVIAR